MAVKNATVGGDLNFRFRMVLKDALSEGYWCLVEKLRLPYLQNQVMDELIHVYPTHLCLPKCFMLMYNSVTSKNVHLVN